LINGKLAPTTITLAKVQIFPSAFPVAKLRKNGKLVIF